MAATVGGGGAGRGGEKYVRTYYLGRYLPTTVL